MKIRLMGTAEQNKEFIQVLKTVPEITITSESKPYSNRGSTIHERVYLEIEIKTVYHPAEVVEAVLNFMDKRISN
ncbi:MAG: hypothetical protein IJW25_01215 [Clostridia bacterium]|nr:hypothetical protein [Alphaproteobacteria bacterium]MBQ8886813.1 hypothetical protein [Candidatus Gastranaerophilales bacterium]MBQ9786067.1 hypothetical protein [Clostridia bacterium]